jgi:trehalose 6-phosphate phosphatase
VSDLLGSGRAGLITDFDGTISPIVARPEDAHIVPRARAALAGLRDQLTVVAVVSGRGVEDLRARVGVDGLAYVGNHGLEIWNEATGRAELVKEARPWVPRLATVLEQLQSEISVPGVLIENKGVTASLHYRLAPDPEAARTRLLDILARRALTSGLRIEEGRMVINLLPPLTVTKGSAVTWLVREHQLGRVVYIGDDITDAHAFRALKVLEQANGEIKTLSIGVVGPETPASIRQLADAGLPSVNAVADLLCRVLETLRANARMTTRAPTDRETR